MSAALLARLIDAGTPADLIAEVALELGRAQAAQELLEQRRSKDRERKRVPRISEESTEVAEIQEKVPSEVSPPAPPLPTNLQIAPLSPPVALDERREAAATCLRKAFPVLPEWMPESFLEFRAMRRSMRNVPYGPAAERRCIAKLTKLRDQGHDPDKLISKAIERGHRTFFEDETTRAGPQHRHKTAAEWREQAEWFSRKGDRANADECRNKAIELETKRAA